ncbi:MAG: o-succinylbenzoate--CoA ligase [Anaerolineales bacterium]
MNPIPLNPIPLNDPLAAAARAVPNNLALLTGEQRITYAELHHQTETLAARLSAEGVRPGQQVAVHLRRDADSVRMFHALARLRAILVPLNSPLPLGAPYGDDKGQGVRVSPRPLGAPYGDDECGAGLMGLLYTSGTTGTSKAAALTWSNLFHSAIASAFRLGTLPNDRWLLTLPLHHIGGLSILYRSALYGSAVILPDFPNDDFDLSILMTRLKETQPTLISLVPTMLHRLLENAGADGFPASLRVILLGGSGAPPALLRRALDVGLPIAATYGLTEAASQVATAPPDLTRRKPGTAGKPLLWVELEIRTEDGCLLPPNEIGEIWTRSPMVMPGYLGQPPLPDGWLRTGDYGYLDTDGDLWVVQRRTDLIITGGENVYPAQVEAALAEHPAIAEVCVVGIPDAEWGQRVAAAVVLHPGAAATPNQLTAFARQTLAGYQTPRLWHFVNELPRTASGKIQRNEIAKILLDAVTNLQD